MASGNSLDAVKRKIQCLQQQADDAEDRAQVVQRQLDEERELRTKVRLASVFSCPEPNSSAAFLPLFTASFLPFLSFYSFAFIYVRGCDFNRGHLIHWRAC